MRVISLVPSLTETLLECGIQVVGRTRFCIHPEELVCNIPVVGGTKNVNWDKCLKLKSDLVVMDREENTRTMAESCPIAWHATHVTSVSSVARNLSDLSDKLQSDKLKAFSLDWKELSNRENQKFGGWNNIPGVLRFFGSVEKVKKIQYMIWREPWMTVSQSTFIGSVLTLAGFGKWLPNYDVPYPQLADIDLPEKDTFYMFSSEPFPFARHVDELESKGFSGALVDGEFFSWFGIRSYRLLKDYMNRSF